MAKRSLSASRLRAVVCACFVAAFLRHRLQSHGSRSWNAKHADLGMPQMQNQGSSHGSRLSHLYAIKDAINAASQGRYQEWIASLNLYLDPSNRTRLHLLEGDGPLLARLSPDSRPHVQAGPLVSVIMVAFNASDTIEYAALSILRQTWANLELYIVDDASLDSTWTVAQSLSKADPRVKLLRNAVQVGPYVSRNIALGHTNGAYVTCHDADDWAMPDRLEVQVRNMMDSAGAVKANMVHHLRVRPNGVVSLFEACPFSPDGVARQAYVSAMFETQFIRDNLGHWDSVRYSGDYEFIERAKTALGPGSFVVIDNIGVLQADRPTSLGKQGYATRPGRTSNRMAYDQSFKDWHQAASPLKDKRSLFLDFPLYSRPFTAPYGMTVNIKAVCACVEADTMAGKTSNRC